MSGVVWCGVLCGWPVWWVAGVVGSRQRPTRMASLRMDGAC
ncbi:MAG: hypothetical protein ACYDBJ_17975 [Aggregatilineales bacterium]